MEWNYTCLLYTSLNTIKAEFKDKNVLLVDDSIVRGTTSEQIVSMARVAGAKKIYFASAAPEIRYPNVYGIDMLTKQELIAYGRNVDEIAKLIGVDKLVFQDLEALTESVRQENPAIQGFDCSVFTGEMCIRDRMIASRVMNYASIADNISQVIKSRKILSFAMNCRKVM